MVAVESVKAYLLNLQTTLCEKLQSYEKTIPFIRDPWQRNEGGGGISAVLQGGEVFESAGVNFSHVKGDKLPASASALRPELAGRSFEALGISSVIHPCNPFVPTTHLNVRLFVAYKAKEAPLWWFGGGFDLTPYYPFLEDVIYWHQIAKKACQDFGDDIYPRYKAWADSYFYLPHRQETRGVGGLFFDDLNEETMGWDFAKCFAFMQQVGNSFWQAYGPLVEKRYQHPFAERQKAFQHYRRGRYVEFNLVYDRGTLFGLQSGGRTESILMSLPPTLSFQYNYSPEPDSPESTLYTHFLKPQDWLEMSWAVKVS